MAKRRAHIFFLSILVCIALALIPPVVLLLVDASQPIVLLAILGCFGWLFAAVLLFKEGLIYELVLEAIGTLGITSSSAGISDTIQEFVEQASRFHRASFTFLTSSNQQNRLLTDNLNRIVKLTKFELDARSVELSLFDEESGLCSQSLLLGEPKSSESQWMLVDEESRSGKQTSISTADIESTVLSTPVRFAGRTFGMLRVEFSSDRVLSESDKQVIELLAAQGGILLVDAQFNDELLRMRKTSEESIRAKTGFLANLSHELRGPLGVILNGAELALEGLCGDLSDAMAESLKMIRGSGEHLLDLVNDVLDYAKMEAGKVQVSTAQLQVKALLEDIVAVVRSQAVGKEQRLLVDPIPDEWALECDKRHARQMMINFLTNAIKYTPAGGTIRVYAEVIANTRVKIIIEDSGIGIPESEQHKVFGAFERVDDAYAMTQRGTGLGMPLTARLAEVNAGAVGFESVQGEGSTFWLTLPFSMLDPSYFEEADAQIVPRVQGTGEQILLVDPDEATASMLQTYLNSLGFETLVAADGPEMMSALRKQNIALALVENDIPNLPGEQVVSMLRAIPQGAAIPLVLMSARAFVFDIEQFLRLGVDRCLAKPITLAELGLTVRLLLDQTEEDKANHIPG